MLDTTYYLRLTMIILLMVTVTVSHTQTDADIDQLVSLSQDSDQSKAWDAITTLIALIIPADTKLAKTYISQASEYPLARLNSNEDLLAAYRLYIDQINGETINIRAASALHSSRSLRARVLSHQVIGSIYATNDQIDSSLVAYRQAQSIVDDISDTYYFLLNSNNIMTIYRMKNQHDLVDSLLVQIESRNIPDIYNGILSQIYYQAGSSNLQRGKVKEGAALYIKGYKYSRPTIYIDRTIALMNQLAIISYYTQDTLGAQRYWQEGSQLISDHDLTNSAAVDFLRNSGILSIEIGDTSLAEITLQQTYHIAKDQGNIIEQIGALGHLANIHAQRGELARSNKEIDLILPHVSEYKDHRKIYNALNGALPAMIRNDRYDTAEALLPIFKNITERTKPPSQSYKYYEYAYQVQKAQGNHKDALKHLEKYQELYNMMSAEVSNQNLLDAKEKYEAEERELKNQLLENQNTLIQKNNDRMKWYLTLLSILLIGLAYLYYLNRKANKTISEQNVELTQVNATKDRLFTIISHDLRSELSAFHSLNQIFSFHLERNNYDRLREIVRDIDHSATHVTNLMDNLLRWASSQLKGIQLYPEAINLHNLVSEFIDSLATYAAFKNIKMVNHVDRNASLFADANSMKFILRNILTNAIKFSNQEGSVEISSTSDDNQTVISIKDHGVGMDTDTLQNIWTIQKKSSRQGTQGERGTGIGLAMVKDFVHRNRGIIDINSIEGHGTEVILLFPSI